MKNLGFALLAVTAVSMLAACGKKDNTAAPPPPACPAGTVCQENLPDTKAAADYFARTFHYQVLGDCKVDPANVRFAWLGLADRATLATNADGSEVTAEVNVFLNDDGSYDGEYQENTQKEIEPGLWSIADSKNRKDLKGKWTVSEVTEKDDKGTDKKVEIIELSTLGTGRAVVKENWPGIAVKFTDDVNPALAGQTLTLVRVRSNVSKDGKTAAQYCADQAAPVAQPAPPPAQPEAPKAGAQ